MIYIWSVSGKRWIIIKKNTHTIYFSFAEHRVGHNAWGQPFQGICG